MNKESIKRIIKQIFEEEKKAYNLNDEFYLVTVVEFYKEHMKKLLKDNKSLKLMSLIKLPISAAGVNFYNYEKYESIIFLFLRRSKIIKMNNLSFYDLLTTCYHEIQHSIQKQFDKYSYYTFLSNIEFFLKGRFTKDYITEHSKYSFEVGANLYGITKAKEYIKNNYPELYEKEKEYIEKEEQQAKFYYQTYDAAETIERFINALKNELKKAKYYAISNLDDISPILPIFFNANLSFKKVNEIIMDEKFKTLDKRIIYAFFSNKTFLETIDFENLTDIELDIVQEALQYTNTLYQKQLEVLSKERKINLLDFLKVEKNIIFKYNLVSNYIKKSIEHKFNLRRNDREKITHMKSISGYLDQANEIKNKKVRGYMTINVIYIMMLILSVLIIWSILFRK